MDSRQENRQSLCQDGTTADNVNERASTDAEPLF